MSENKGPRVVAAAVSVIVIQLVVLFLRFWSRAISTKARFWWDDWTVLAALVSLCWLLQCNCKGLTYENFEALFTVALRLGTILGPYRIWKAPGRCHSQWNDHETNRHYTLCNRLPVQYWDHVSKTQCVALLRASLSGVSTIPDVFVGYWSISGQLVDHV